MTEPRTPDPAAPPEPAAPEPAAPEPSRPDPTAPPAPWEPTAAPTGQPNAPRRRGSLMSAVIVIAAAAVGLGSWYVISQGAELLGDAFGAEIWRRLPADARDDFERRLKVAAGDLESMSNTEAGRQIQARVQAGMLRLDDATLLRRLNLQTLALAKIDDTTCGQFAKASFAGSVQPDEVASKLMEVMTEAELRDWFNVAVLAIEAEARKAPEPRRISEGESNAVFQRLIASLDETAFQQLQTGAATGATPAEACVAARTMYGAVERLSEADQRLIALADVSL